jgi:hypothetical protein
MYVKSSHTPPKEQLFSLILASFATNPLYNDGKADQTVRITHYLFATTVHAGQEDIYKCTHFYQIVVADMYGDISFSGLCALDRKYKYIGFFKYPNLIQYARAQLTDGGLFILHSFLVFVSFHS